MSDEIAPQPQIKITWLIGTAAAFAIFVVIGAYSSRMTWTYSDYDQQRAEVRKANLAEVQKAENALIYPAVDAKGQAHAEWVDQATGIVRVPIEQAMAEEVDTLKAKPAAAGNEIPGAVPAPAPAAPLPSAGATNAAPIAPAAPAKAGAPAVKPKAGAKPVKTTLLSPDQTNQPVFNTRKINTQPGVDTQLFKGFITYGGVPIPINPSATPAAGPAAATSN